MPYLFLLVITVILFLILKKLVIIIEKKDEDALKYYLAFDTQKVVAARNEYQSASLKKDLNFSAWEKAYAQYKAAEIDAAKLRSLMSELVFDDINFSATRLKYNFYIEANIAVLVGNKTIDEVQSEYKEIKNKMIEILASHDTKIANWEQKIFGA